jgi:MSHA biogenesis protein MshP
MNARQSGFALVAAIFLLVVLASLGAVAVRISTAQSSGASQSLLGGQALQAAKSGAAWAAHRAIGGSCDTQTTTLAEAGTAGFVVNTSCSQTSHAEGPTTTNVFIIDVLAQRGQYGTADYVSRRMQIKITDVT